MKTFEHPELQLLQEIHKISEKYPEITELVDLEKRAREFYETNSLSELRFATLNAIIGSPMDSSPEYKEKIYQFMVKALRYLEFEEMDQGPPPPMPEM
jgi:hypothetical protein